MGYELHIVRRSDWEDYEEDSNISLEEWLAYVSSDEELELTNGYQTKVPGTQNSFENIPGFCIWRGYSIETEHKPWFSYGHGMISAKYPDDETIKKMIAIADKLNGKVQGDDGEFYDENYFVEKFNQAIAKMSNELSHTPWWKFW